jgi:hypothetical protein
MSDGQTTERDLEREERRLQRLRLIVTPQQEGEEPEEDFDPGPQEAA